jgi:hypothetical protein
MMAMQATAAQGAGPGAPTATVGDTIWVSRTVAVPAGATLRPADWDAPEPIERLGAPRVSPRGDSAEVSYPIVVWRTGPLTIDIPGPLVLGAGGRVDSLPPQPVQVTIASVLPAVAADSTLPPQPRADYVPRTSASIVPLVMLLLLAALLLAPLHWWWRRRGSPRPRPALPTGEGAGAPLERWADAGETRAVAAVATGRLRAMIAERMPSAHTALDTEALLQVIARRADWPLADLADVLRSLDEARFGNAAFPDAVGLARWADELAPRLTTDLG